MIDPDTYWPVNNKRLDARSIASKIYITSSRVSKRKTDILKRNATFTDHSLDRCSGMLRCHLNTILKHLLDENDKEEGSCQI